MSDKQKAAAGAASLGSRYQQIAAIFEQLPERFKIAECMRAAGIKDCVVVRGAVGALLWRDFKCIQVGTRSNRIWKKPEAKKP